MAACGSAMSRRKLNVYKCPRRQARRATPRLFPNLVRATALTVHQECNEGDEDQEAGFAGAPFVQPAHDEEWMEYIDWGEVEAQAGGSSSSGA